MANSLKNRRISSVLNMSPKVGCLLVDALYGTTLSSILFELLERTRLFVG